MKTNSKIAIAAAAVGAWLIAKKKGVISGISGYDPTFDYDMEFKLGSKEWYDLIHSFETQAAKKLYMRGGLDKESKELWERGHVYSNGEVNNIFQAYMMGYMNGRRTWIDILM